MTSKLEECARAVCSQRCLRQEAGIGACVLEDGRNGPCEASPDQLLLGGRVDTARAVLEALRIPDEGMMDVRTAVFLPMDRAIPRFEPRPDGHTWHLTSEDLKHIWQAMIDHILKEG